MAALRLRCKCDTGTHTLPTSLFSTSTLEDLKEAIHSVSGIFPEYQRIMTGYPPKAVDLSNSLLTLNELKVSSGDTFTLVDTDRKKIVEKQTKAQVQKVEMKRKEVPADNSCLFYSVYFALHGSLNESSYHLAKEYRRRIANIVVSNQEKYSTVFLGKSPHEYGVWIQCDTSWGGAIELSILSEIFQLEIVALDIQSLRSDQFGQDQNYNTRIFLLYDGAHYDPIYLDSGDSSLPIQTIFEATDMVAYDKALSLAGDENRRRQYVDFQNFKLRCITCGQRFKGQAAAKEHAEKSGHGNFGEV